MKLANVVDGVPQVVDAVRERTVRAILDAIAACIRIINTYSRLVITEMIASFCVARCSMQVRAAASTTKSAIALAIRFALCFIEFKLDTIQGHIVDRKCAAMNAHCGDVSGHSKEYSALHAD